MRDKFGRELTYLRVSLIDRCNLKCLYCMPNGTPNPFKENELLDFDEIVRTVSLFAELGITKVRLTGGEPLLRKDVPSLVRRVKALPGIREVVMTTNAVLLKNFAHELKEAGLDRINVSLDTLNRETFRRITALDKLEDVLTGIDAAAAAGIGPIKINAVLMKGFNDGEILDLVSWAAERSFDLRFIEWMPTAAEIGPERASRYLSVADARRVIEEKCGLAPEETDPSAPARNFRVPGSPSRIGFISPLSNAFCGSCNRLRLKANGMMKTCLHGQEDLDIRRLLREGAPDAYIKGRIEAVVFDRPEEHFLNNSSVRHNDFVMTAVGG